MAQVILPLSGKRCDAGIRDAVKRGPTSSRWLLLLIPIGVGIARSIASETVWPAIVGVALGFTLAQAPKIAKQWERAVVLRLGRYVGLARPGPVLDPAVRRYRDPLDRSAGDHHQLRRRADADLRHRAGQRRRGAVLAGLRP